MREYTIKTIYQLGKDYGLSFPYGVDYPKIVKRLLEELKNTRGIRSYLSIDGSHIRLNYECGLGISEWEDTRETVTFNLNTDLFKGKSVSYARTSVTGADRYLVFDGKKYKLTEIP